MVYSLKPSCSMFLIIIFVSDYTKEINSSGRAKASFRDPEIYGECTASIEIAHPSIEPYSIKSLVSTSNLAAYRSLLEAIALHKVAGESMIGDI